MLQNVTGKSLRIFGLVPMMITTLAIVAVIIKYDSEVIAYMIPCYLKTRAFQTELTLFNRYLLCLIYNRYGSM